MKKKEELQNPQSCINRAKSEEMTYEALKDALAEASQESAKQKGREIIVTELEQLERTMDEKTLAFWEAIERKDAAMHMYDIAELEMRRAKGDYLRAKLAKGASDSRK